MKKTCCLMSFQSNEWIHFWFSLIPTDSLIYHSIRLWFVKWFDFKPSQMGFYRQLTCNGEQKYPWRSNSSCSQSHLDFLGATRRIKQENTMKNLIYETVKQKKNWEEKETIPPLFSSPAAVPASRWLFSLQPYSVQPHTASVCYPDWCSGSEPHLPVLSSVSLLQ